VLRQRTTCGQRDDDYWVKIQPPWDPPALGSQETLGLVLLVLRLLGMRSQTQPNGLCICAWGAPGLHPRALPRFLQVTCRTRIGSSSNPKTSPRARTVGDAVREPEKCANLGTQAAEVGAAVDARKFSSPGPRVRQVGSCSKGSGMWHLLGASVLGAHPCARTTVGYGVLRRLNWRKLWMGRKVPT
jgi:hypothetical protein